MENLLLDCPFCGHAPRLSTSYMPTLIEVDCINDECFARPQVSETVTLEENKGDTVTYTPLFEKHYPIIIEKWNYRG